MKGLRRRTIIAGGVAFYVLLCLLPIYWMVVTSLKENADLYDRSVNPLIFNALPTLEHYRYLLENTLFLGWLRNTLLVGVAVIGITLALAVPGAYAFARWRFPGRQGVGLGIFICYLIPPTLLFIPFSRVIGMLGLQDSLWALVLTYPTFTVPFCTWLLAGFIRKVPYEIEEAALVDGCSRPRAVVSVVMPLIVPGIVVASVFALTATLQEFVYALSFISSSAQKTVILGVTTDLIRGDVFFWGSLMSGAVLTGIPIVIAYVLFLEHFVGGFSKTALK